MHFSNQQRDFSSIGLSERGGIVAYFSMEIAIAPDMPTYSGGLGVLAGDTMRSAADLGLGLCAVTLLHRKGYFQQHLDAQGIQSAEDQPWPLEKFLPLEESPGRGDHRGPSGDGPRLAIRSRGSHRAHHPDLPARHRSAAERPARSRAHRSPLRWGYGLSACARKPFWASAACASSRPSITT